MITFPPQMRDGSPEAMVYRHIAQQCMSRMNQARGSLKMFTQRFILNNGVEIICSHCYGKEDIWVKIPPVVVGTTEVETVETYGFFCKPRTTDIGYPNQDDAIAVYLHFKDGEWVTDPGQLPIERPTQFYYGNIDWKGPLDEDGSGNVLSWKGPPTRYFPLDPRQHYEGLTVWDEDVLTYEYGMPIEVPYYTCFGPNIYEGGDVLVAMPQFGATPTKVLGAAYGLDNKLFVLVGVNYRDMENPDSTEDVPSTGGFFTELYVRDAGSWQNVAYWNAGRHSVPFFFNQSGTQAVTVIGGNKTVVTISSELIGDTKLYSAVSVTTDTNNMSYSFTKNTDVYEHNMAVELPDPWAYVDRKDYADVSGLERYAQTTVSSTISKTGAVVVAADYKADTLVESVMSISANNVSTSVLKDGGYYDLLEEYPYDPPTGVSAQLYNNGGGVWDVGQTPVSGLGGCAPYRFSGKGVSVNATTGAITSLSCVSGSSATATVTVTDARGISSTSSPFRVSGGSWGPQTLVLYGTSYGGGYLSCDHVCEAMKEGYTLEGLVLRQYLYADRPVTTGAIQVCSEPTWTCYEWGYYEQQWICP